MARYEQGFLAKLAEKNGNSLPFFSAMSSLAGLADKGDYARFFLEDDPTRKKDFNKYVLQATNPEIDYRSDKFSSLFDQFVNANLSEMRKRKLKRILLEVVAKPKGNTASGAAWFDGNATKDTRSSLSGKQLGYMFSKKPWEGQDGVFVTSSGKPVFEVPL